ncbi:MAG: L-serine ammonia-lyase, iron-sulfur-dependent, subunit alpha [Lachnospiraceae bacterium]|nr:L-serine ammonia-lyase, iron-sulfur-dependent, subunit alpha [Lachnospiraceae bacterium]
MYSSLFDICGICEREGISFWEAIQKEDASEQNIECDKHFKIMTDFYLAMKKSDENYDENLKSHSGLVGGEAKRISDRRKENKLLCGDFCGSVMEKALRVSESNACMKRIVASPTAGSCGVVPAALVSYQERYGLSDDKMVEALYVSGGIGEVIAKRATLSGAEGGCQAEIGSASAMAAGALCFLMGGDAEQICNAAAMALKGLLGLACDPVAGLVEVPCVKRNVIGAINAVTSADMAMAGIKSKIPADEVIDAMKSIGRGMSPDIRETGNGGLAATPTGKELVK